MIRRPLDRIVLLAAVAGLGACASGKAAQEPVPAAATTPVATAAAEPAREWEPWPPPGVAAVTAHVADSTFKAVQIHPKDGGWQISEICDMIAKGTGSVISFDATSQVFKQARLDWTGPIVIPEARLFDWYQAMLAQRKLVLIPVGPALASGGHVWQILDQADPQLRSRPTYIDESEVYDYADRDGLFVTTALRVRDTVDATRVRNALQLLVTQTAGIGKLQDLGSRFLVVADFAPVVASMKRILDRINAETPPSAPIRPYAPPPAAAK